MSTDVDTSDGALVSTPRGSDLLTEIYNWLREHEETARSKAREVEEPEDQRAYIHFATALERTREEIEEIVDREGGEITDFREEGFR